MAAKYLDLSLQEFDDNVFGPEPNWPPDVSPFLSDVCIVTMSHLSSIVLSKPD